MKVAICQYNIKWEDKEYNKNKIKELLDGCERKNEIDWLVFSEMTLSGFTMNKEASTLNEADLKFFSELAKKHSINITFGGVENEYNNIITLNRKGERINAYSKIHLYSFGQEDKHYKAGAKQSIFELEGFRIMPSVCFDLRFPYLFWNMADKSDIFVNMAAWPMKRSDHWMTLLKARAIENQCCMVGVNRIGLEGKIEFSGNSIAFDSMGVTVVDAKSQEGVFVAETPFQMANIEKIRSRFPFAKDRKSIQYS
ncbi:MAG: hypothetical protein KKD35_01310 [Elusimicrobia bacterium]|nr:hypothetical protein [Elusimicrobiota bacterium]